MRARASPDGLRIRAHQSVHPERSAPPAFLARTIRGEVRDGNGQRPERDQQESHALPLSDAERQEEIAEQSERPDRPRRAPSRAREGTARRLARTGARSCRSDRRHRERHDGEEHIKRRERQGPFGRVQHLVEPGPAEDGAKEWKDGIPGMDVGSQIPPPANSNRCGEIDKHKASPRRRCEGTWRGGGRHARSKVAEVNKPQRTSAGYFTPIARPAKSPAVMAAR